MGVIIDKTYYRENKISLDTTDEILDNTIKVAEKNIQLMVNQSLNSITVNMYLKEAVVSETEFLLANDVMSVYSEGGVESASLGDFSYKESQKDGKAVNSNNSNVCSRTYQYLLKGGYVYKGINSYYNGGVERCI